MTENQATHETVNHNHSWTVPDPRVKIKLERGQRGTYAWEVTAEHESYMEAIRLVRQTDLQLRKEYGGNGGE